MNSACKIIRNPLAFGLLVVLGLVFTSVTQASIIITFDDIDASGGPITGTSLTSYLGSYGITISDVTSNVTPMIVDDRDTSTTDMVHAASDYNFLWNALNTNDPHSYTMNFETALDSLSFTRVELVAATSSGLIVSPWTIDAYDGSGNIVDSVGEEMLGFYGTSPAVTYTLDGDADIVKIVVYRDSTNYVAGCNSVGLDNLTLDPVPEPSTLVLLGMCIATCQAFFFRRRQ